MIKHGQGTDRSSSALGFQDHNLGETLLRINDVLLTFPR